MIQKIFTPGHDFSHLTLQHHFSVCGERLIRQPQAELSARIRGIPAQNVGRYHSEFLSKAPRQALRNDLDAIAAYAAYRKSCIRKGYALPTEHIDINLSFASLKQSGVATKILKTAQQHGLTPQDIGFETVEIPAGITVSGQDWNNYAENIAFIARAGFGITIDDLQDCPSGDPRLPYIQSYVGIKTDASLTTQIASYGLESLHQQTQIVIAESIRAGRNFTLEGAAIGSIERLRNNFTRAGLPIDHLHYQGWDLHDGAVIIRDVSLRAGNDSQFSDLPEFNAGL